MSAFVVENVRGDEGRRLFSLLGVRYVATRWAWLSPLMMLALGGVVAWASAGEATTPVLVGRAVLLGMLALLGIAAHGLGHIISSRLIGAPMHSLILTGTVAVTHFEDPRPQPRRVHVLRALGGPIANLALAVASLGAWTLGAGMPIAFFGIVNASIGVFTLLPIKSLDGAVLWLGAGDSGEG
jgi:membrane-associated protease RseP (regulator of RpoE activity)